MEFLFSGNNELIDYYAQIAGITNEGFSRILKTDAHGQLRASGTDIGNRNSFVTTFGQVVTSQKDTQISEQFAYGLPGTGVLSGTTGTGEIATEDSLLKIRNTGSGDGTAYVQSLQCVRYIPGSMAYLYFTVSGLPYGVDGANAWCGLFDDEDGFAIGMQDGVPSLLRRRYNGIDADDYIISIDDFDDKLDGNGKSGYTINWDKGQLFAIMFGYLGFAPISFLVKKDDDEWVEFHKIRYPNSNIETHISFPYLPIRFEIDNTGAGVPISIHSGSVDAGIFNGGKTDSTFSYSSVGSARAANVPITSTDALIIAIRGKEILGDRVNKISSLLDNVGISTEGSNRTVSFSVVKNPTVITDGTWTSISDNSPLEFSTNTVFNLNTGSGTGVQTVIFKEQVYRATDLDNISVLLRRGETLVFRMRSGAPGGTISDYVFGFKDLF